MGNKKAGDKGEPGQAVDCSGMVSVCIVASGLENPVGKGKGRGVEQIIQASTKIDDVNSIEVGNAVTFNTGNPTSHIGLISSVTRDDAGNVIFYKVIQSGSSTGPKEVQIGGDGGNSYYTSKVSGFYKWDTPDKPVVASGNSQTVQEKMTIINPYTNQTLIIPKPQQQYFKAYEPKLSDYIKQSKAPIVRDIGAVLQYFGF